jgi:hypothetical protein
MGVFIGWSGKNTKSYKVADALRRWLEKVIQASKPWMSEQDIDAGQRWATELFGQLDSHRVAIICVTKDNQDQPWINFEAGALAKQLKSDKSDEIRVCPLLIEMTENDVSGPLKLLQMVPLTRDGIFKVLEMVNEYAVEDHLKESVLKDSFEKRWPDLQAELEQTKIPEQPEKSTRSVEEMLEEILSLVRSIDKATGFTTGVTRFFPSVNVADLALQAVASGTAQDTIAQSLKAKLMAEVAKSDPLVAETLGHGSPEFSDETLILKFAVYLPTGFEYLMHQRYSDVLKKAAGALGYRVKLVRGVTSFDASNLP